jgi:hypothetical protein
VGGSLLTRAASINRLSILGLLAWLLLNAVVALPDHLGWQNELGWASSRWSGKPALIGDSLDWGQDLARLGAWVGRHGREGSTLVCVYDFGEGDPYRLKPPAARPTSDPGEHAAYLAVSANILFGYEAGHCIQVAGGHSSLSQDQREALLRLQPCARVGRTIRIYRLRDLPPAQQHDPTP